MPRCQILGVRKLRAWISSIRQRFVEYPVRIYPLRYLYPNPGGHAASTPYLQDVQSDLLDALDSRMVIPLRSLAHFAQVNLPTRLTPLLSIEAKDYLLERPKRGAVPQRILKTPAASLANEQAYITAALDFLCQGY
jgi:toxin CcdB